MFRRKAVGQRDGLLQIAHDDNGAVLAKRLRQRDFRPAAIRVALPTARATARASFAEGVSSSAVASTSCSACASRSAASQEGFPSAAMSSTSVGPATKSIAISRATKRLAAAT